MVRINMIWVDGDWFIRKCYLFYFFEMFWEFLFYVDWNISMMILICLIFNEFYIF